MANPYNLNFGQTFGVPILEALGARPTPEKLKFFNAWGLAEGTKARNNPYGTTRKGYPGESFLEGNPHGVKQYPDLRTGIQATVDTLKNGYYDSLVQLLKDPNASATDLAKAVAASPWGTGLGVLRVLGASSSDLEEAASASSQRVTALESSQSSIQQSVARPVLKPSPFYLNTMKNLGGGAAFIAGLSERLQAYNETEPQLPAASEVATNPELRAQNWGGTTKASKPFKPTGSNAVDRMLQIAHAQIGKPYVWGAESPAEGGFDCSGLIEYAFEQAGIPTPGRITTYTAKNMGRSVKDGPYKPGDWIITGDGGHMVMYVGGGQVIAAPRTGEVVQYQPLSRFDGKILDVRRVIETPTRTKKTPKGKAKDGRK